MRALTLLAWGCAACLQLSSCNRRVLVGSLPGEEETPLGGQGGSKIVDPGEKLPTSLVFSSTFESGDLSEWGLEGNLYTASAGEIHVQNLQVHTGSSAAEVVTTETGGHVVMGVGGAWSEVLVRFWIRVDALYQTRNWPILHIDAEQDGGLEQLWDLGLDSSNGETYALFLWEMPAVAPIDEGRLAATSTVTIPVGTWSEITVHLLASPDETGFIRVFLDGSEVLNLSGRPAGTGDPLRFGFGSFAYDLEPRPASYALDDVEILIP